MGDLINSLVEKEHAAGLVSLASAFYLLPAAPVPGGVVLIGTPRPTPAKTPRPAFPTGHCNVMSVACR